ncbi:hypothetical protein Val02_37360 [Virgisporangium aliadipatigenens]|uniref:Beta-lactamase class A catalytic domain-containing protein n=1 Tax=Virgisporangium aliadipatigenens TaxID=741659 RepID=A0A8J3YMX4_9ACTN|nr:serine hydrolase [Virgisporangium aliadipatigenens]GIJ46850.1 hypothetical protein Val02_37360 [Virgisporangium aliadipatigenens]
MRRFGILALVVAVLVAPVPGPAVAAAAPVTSAAGLAVRTVRAVTARSRTDVLVELDARTGAPFSVAVLDRRTGRSYGYRDGVAFETASVVKVALAAALLLRGNVTAAQRRLMAAMIRSSDNDATRALWDVLGGASGVTALMAPFGLTGTVFGASGSWGLTTTTAADQVRLLDAVVDPAGPLGPAGSAELLGLMSTVDSDQDWGVSAAASTVDTVALKNGWLARSTENGRWIVNSVGRITGPSTDLVVAVLSHGNATMAAGVDLVESIARLSRGGA